MLKTGDAAPAFTLPQTDGTNLSLLDLRGKKAVVYFYPKDSTPGCTTEAIDFSQHKAAFEACNTIVIGVSKDSLKRHQNFTDKNNLTITLLSDEEGKMIDEYGVWVEKSLYGRKYMGIERATFLIDSKGKIAQIWHKVKVKGHAAEVLKAAQSLA
jgi:thioredoxin-dependent peroxiredoxin